MFFSQGARQNQRLVETAFAQPFDMQRHGENQGTIGEIDIRKGEIRDERSQDFTGGNIAVVFELMNGVQNDVFVTEDGAGGGEIRFFLQAFSAQVIFRRTVGKSRAADGAHAAVDEIDFVIAFRAKHLTGERMQDFGAAETSGRENHFAEIV